MDTLILIEKRCPMKRYSEEFKAEAVRLVLESGVSRQPLRISTVTIRAIFT